ncbi:hypothetical protein EJB05_18058, partial [Eragrostis curvula]
MGAAATKAVDELADAPKPQAELRLAVAEQFLLQWRPSRRADTGIWDAEAVCVNRGLLSALDDIVHLKEIQAFPMASPARTRMDSALAVAMSRLMEEFLLLRVWDASGLQGLTGLGFADETQRSASASLAFFKSCSTSTDELSLKSTSDELYASSGSHSSRPDMVTVVVDGTFLDDLDLICPGSLPVLHEIALRVIRAGYTGELIRTFTKPPCDVLDRFLSILQGERCCLEADSISFEDAEWWTTEDMVKRWIVASKLVGKTLVLIYVLEVYEALSNAAPGFLFLFPGEHANLISGTVAVVLAKLARYAMICVELLAPHRTALDLALATGGEDERGALAEGAEAVTSFGVLVAELIEGLERNLEEKSALVCADADGSAAHLFLANNVSYVLNRAADADVLSLLGDEWAARRRSRLERHAASYVEASWGAVVACLKTGGAAKGLAKFNAAFKIAHDNQVFREVPDPALRAALRKSVSEMVVPAYSAFVRKHPKFEKYVRYTADGLAQSLSDLFEGEAELGRKN